jgi:hypothetical protein
MATQIRAQWYALNQGSYMIKLRKFWFEFTRIDEPTPLNLGCGVTAYTKDDAEMLVKSKIFADHEMPEICNIIDDVEFGQLEQQHVAPNIGNMFIRGVWFPLGY